MKQSNRFLCDLVRKLGFASRSRSATIRSKRSHGRRPTFEMLEARQMLSGHPTDLALVGDSVLENSANGTVVGMVTTAGPSAGNGAFSSSSATVNAAVHAASSATVPRYNNNDPIN